MKKTTLEDVQNWVMHESTQKELKELKKFLINEIKDDNNTGKFKRIMAIKNGIIKHRNNQIKELIQKNFELNKELNRKNYKKDSIRYERI
jgi:hypothetical protein